MLKFENVATVGDYIRAYDFKPMRGRMDSYVEGVVLEVTNSQGYKAFKIKVKNDVYVESGKTMTRTWYETPCGTLTSLQESAGFTTWIHEKLFKSPEDYKALRFLLQDEIFEPSYDAFVNAEKTLGGDAICRAGFGLEPLQSLISSNCMAMQDFCMEWMIANYDGMT